MYIYIYIYIYIYLSKRWLNIKNVNTILRLTMKKTIFFGTQSYLLLAQQSSAKDVIR